MSVSERGQATDKNVHPAIKNGRTKKSIAVSPSKSITISVENTASSEVLKKICKQAGIEVADRRIEKPDAKISLNLKNASFFQALDVFAKMTGCALSFSQPKIPVALVDGRPPIVAPSHHGVFRGVLQRVTTSQFFDTAARRCRMDLQLAWEPWFRPLFVRVNSFNAKANGFEEKGSGGARHRLAKQSRVADLQLNFGAPARTTQQLQRLKCELAVVGINRFMDVTFAKLAPLNAGKAKTIKQKGAAIAIEEFRKLGPKTCSAKIHLRYPKGGPMFDSYEFWWVLNQAWLQKRDNPARKIMPPADPRFTHPTSNEVVLHYFFRGGTESAAIKDLANWELVCRVPERIVEVTVPFEFNKIPLP